MALLLSFTSNSFVININNDGDAFILQTFWSSGFSYIFAELERVRLGSALHRTPQVDIFPLPRKYRSVGQIWPSRQMSVPPLLVQSCNGTSTGGLGYLELKWMGLPVQFSLGLLVNVRTLYPMQWGRMA